MDNITVEDIYLEWKAQLELFVKEMGKKPTHLDSHHHVHLIHEKAKEAISRLATECDLPVRGITINNCTSIVLVDFYGEDATIENAKVVIKKLFAEDADNYEFCCHPGFIDQTIIDATSYNVERLNEYEVLTSVEFLDYLTGNQIELTTY